MRIGSRFAEGGNGWNFTYMKLYSLKVYDAGVLVRDYVPFVQDGMAGLYDKKNGAFVTDAIGTAPMKVAGVGEPVAPISTVCVSHGKSVTLNGGVSGALGYQWYMNGTAIEGATNATHTVAWRSGTPDTDTLQVVPTFDVFGVPTTGDPFSLTVAYLQQGLQIIVR